MMCKITNKIANVFLINLIFTFCLVDDLVSNYQQNVARHYFLFEIANENSPLSILISSTSLFLFSTANSLYRKEITAK